MEDSCTIFKTTSFIGKRWTLLILLELYKGGKKWKRYTEIKNQLKDITPKMLSSRLKDLDKEGLVTKRINIEQFPIRSEYSLTKSGEDFISIIKEMKAWAFRWDKVSSFCSKNDCKDCKL